MAFKNGIAEKRLKAFCKRFDVELGEDFYGFKVGHRRVRYRRGNSFQLMGKYWRWQWKNPLSSRHEQWTHILFHAPENEGHEEMFFVMQREEIEKLARKWPQVVAAIDLSAYDEDAAEAIQAREPRGPRKELADHGKTLEQFQRWLKL